MDFHRERVIRAAVHEAGLPPGFAVTLQAECPWLNGAEEVNESFGPDLLAEQSAAADLTQEQIVQFFYAYNACVRAQEDPFQSLQSECHARVCAALVGEGRGRADAGGKRDYWVNEYSFSTSTPTVVVADRFRFSQKAVQALQRILSEYPGVFSELRISSMEGGEVLTLYPS